jgi:hypothetical protein
MAETDTEPQVSRRQFLAGCGAAGAATVGVPIAGAQKQEAESPALSPPTNAPLGAGGDISQQGHARIAAVDRQFQQQRGSMQQTLDAVEDLGLDPSGSEPINGTFESEISGLSNVRVEFPSDGVFIVTDQMVIRPSGPIELVGNGCTFKLQSEIEHRILNIDGLPSGSLIQGFTFASTGTTTFGNRIATDGTVRLQDLTYQGYMRSDQSNPNNVQGLLSPVAESSSATVQVRNMKAVGGTPAGTHDDGDKPESAPENQIASPMGIWVGQQTQGTVQLVECQLRGWSNGVYGGRTNGIVEVAGGTYWLNLNSQLRLGGGSVIDGATLLLDDREWSMEENPGPYSIGENQGVYAIRVDAKKGNTSDSIRFRNVEIQAKSMQQGAAVIEFESAAGPGIFENCRIMNHLDRPVIRGLSPAGGVAQSNVMVENCLIGGSSPAAVMEMQDRPQSRISNTCITIPDAGPEDINGAQIGENVSFGRCTSGSGLTAPDEVGSGGNVSSLPAPNGSAVNGSAGARSQREGPSKGVLAGVVNGVFMLLFILLGMIAMFVVGLVGTIGAFIGASGGD